MKSHRKVLTFHIPTRIGFVNITPEVAAAVAESGVREGLCLVNPCTASVYVNDESGLLSTTSASSRAGASRAHGPLAAQPHRGGQRRRT
jgi:hypothetical protein